MIQTAHDMIETGQLLTILQLVSKMADDTRLLVDLLRRSLILQAMLFAIIGLVTAFNLWILVKAIKVTREVIKIAEKLIEGNK